MVGRIQQSARLYEIANPKVQYLWEIIMMTKEETELLTRVGPGTPAGEWFRQYWQPVALTNEMPVGGPPKQVRLLGEDLVLFRDDKGELGLLDLYCSHRGTNLSYGRVEDGGLRCLYHGWLYDIRGKCLEQPAEPGGGKERESIRHRAYPCCDFGGFIFTYMGPGEPPQLPPFEALLSDSEHRFIKKYLIECNYLQSSEGDVDSSHLSILHTQFDASEGTPYRLYVQDRAPQIEVEPAEFGMRTYAVRNTVGKKYLRTSYFIMPDIFIFPEASGLNGWTVNLQVPIDDTHTYKYQLTYSRDKALDLEKLRAAYEANIFPDFRLKRNQNNRYMQDREEMKTKTFTGMSVTFGVHDAFASESPGPIRDRTREHLFSSDIGLVVYRKLLTKAIKDVQEGRDAPRVPIEAGTNKIPYIQVIAEIIPSSANMREYVEAAVKSPRRIGQQ
jgi:nitrite reductase/ring-hydroxylating ferredoxin subunit